MAKKDVQVAKKATADRSSDDRSKKGSVAPGKGVRKEDLIQQIRKHKQEIQEMRFGLSKEAQRKGSSRKRLRQQVARAATKLTTLRKSGVVGK
ncbi:MAG: hypothetical protein OXB96_01245 [Candidatus Kaiserbacteria bacterium]|nr:hypothetical protein [Candidatus Kaiserbacteria bacterium]